MKELDKVKLDIVKSKVQLVLNKRFVSGPRTIINLHRDRLNFACPFCGDSSDDNYKKRGNLYFNNLMYHCYNGGCSHPHSNFIEFIKEFNESITNLDDLSSFLDYMNNNKYDKFIISRVEDSEVFSKFKKYGFNASSFHADLTQEERNKTIEDFKNKKIKILFATDIAARGLHVDDISCVVNYDLPRATADYIHRIGRTGRAGKSGVALSFIGLEDFEHFALIEKRCDIKLEKEQIEGFELVGMPTKKEKGKEPIKGKRKSKKDKLREQALKD